MEKSISDAIEQFYQLVNSTQSTEAAEKLTRLAATMPTAIAIPALARLCVLISARTRFDQARAIKCQDQEAI